MVKANARIMMEHGVMTRLREWSRIMKTEFFVMGVVIRDDNDFYVVDAIIPKQSASSAHATIEEPDNYAMIQEAKAIGYTPDQLRCWIHSHCHLKAFWSEEDEGMIEHFNTGEWSISIVINRDGDILSRLDVYSPIRLTIHDIPVEEYTYLTEDERKAFSEQILCKVSEDTSAFNTFGHQPEWYLEYLKREKLNHWRDVGEPLQEEFDQDQVCACGVSPIFECPLNSCPNYEGCADAPTKQELINAGLFYEGCLADRTWDFQDYQTLVKEEEKKGG